MQNVQHAANEVENYDSNEPDSLFGICQAAGEDLGINPFFLRIGLIGVLFFNPLLMLGSYIGLGILVGASRALFPKPQQAESSAENIVVAHQAPEAVDREPELIAA